jgi:hypothetical protein
LFEENGDRAPLLQFAREIRCSEQSELVLWRCRSKARCWKKLEASFKEHIFCYKSLAGG